MSDPLATLREALRDGVLLLQELGAYGLPRHVLEGKRFVLMHPRVWRWHELEPTVAVRSQAALLSVPDSVVSHLTGLHLRGVLIGGTNGKGSTQALVASVLREAGYR